VKTEYLSIPNTTAGPKDLPFGYVSLYIVLSYLLFQQLYINIPICIYRSSRYDCTGEENIDY